MHFIYEVHETHPGAQGLHVPVDLSTKVPDGQVLQYPVTALHSTHETGHSLQTPGEAGCTKYPILQAQVPEATSGTLF